MIYDAHQRPLRDLRISVTDRCNFRCTYCMPAELFGEGYAFLPSADLLTFEEIERLTRIIARLGAVKLRLTGGEPLLRPHLESLITRLSQLEGVQDIAMTTNGVLLPQKAALLHAAGLQRITISLDTLDAEVFQQMNGQRAKVDRVLAGIAAAQATGLNPIKINVVVQRGVNDHTLLDIATYCKTHGYIARFIEYMDVGTMNGWQMNDVVPAQEIVARIHAVYPLEALTPTYTGEVARKYRYLDGSGEIGVITSVTQPFCGSCSRLRLSPDGQLFTCLFAATGTDLRTPLRAGASDTVLEAIIKQMWQARTDRYSQQRAELRTQRQHKVEMYHIGG